MGRPVSDWHRYIALAWGAAILLCGSASAHAQAPAWTDDDADLAVELGRTALREHLDPSVIRVSPSRAAAWLDEGREIDTLSRGASALGAVSVAFGAPGIVMSALGLALGACCGTAGRDLGIAGAVTGGIALPLVVLAIIARVESHGWRLRWRAQLLDHAPRDAAAELGVLRF